MAEIIGIRDDMFIGKGHTYMQEVSEAVKQGQGEAGVLEQRPTLVNLQCDIDHPTQTMADSLHLINEFGGLDKLRGKKIARPGLIRRLTANRSRFRKAWSG